MKNVKEINYMKHGIFKAFFNTTSTTIKNKKMKLYIKKQITVLLDFQKHFSFNVKETSKTRV
jgi:hypothetical protein